MQACAGGLSGSRTLLRTLASEDTNTTEYATLLQVYQLATLTRGIGVSV